MKNKRLTQNSGLKRLVIKTTILNRPWHFLKPESGTGKSTACQEPITDLVSIRRNTFMVERSTSDITVEIRRVIMDLSWDSVSMPPEQDPPQRVICEELVSMERLGPVSDSSIPSSPLFRTTGMARVLVSMKQLGVSRWIAITTPLRGTAKGTLFRRYRILR